MTNPRSRRKRLLAGAAVAGLISTLGPLGVSPAGAQAANTSTACANVPATSNFTDIAGVALAPEIRCAAAAGVLQGTSATTFNPTGQLSRGQAALAFARFVDAAGGALDAPAAPDLPTLPAYNGTNRFTDVAASETELVQAVNRLAQANIILGKTATTFDPTGNVTRGQLASITNRIQQYLTGAQFPAGPNRFTDDNGSVHEDAINRVAQAGIVQGTTATTFNPNGNASRAQVAAFAVRHIAVNQGALLPIPAPAGTATIAVTPSAAVVTQVTLSGGSATAASSRQYSATVQNATSVAVALFNASAVSTNATGTVQFSAATATTSTETAITVVNGVPTSPGNTVTNVSVSGGALTFVVNASGTASTAPNVVPVVFIDTNGNGVLDGLAGAGPTALRTPTEPFGIGGSVRFIPAAAASSNVAATSTATYVNRDTNTFSTTTNTFTYDENDQFSINGGVQVPLATFEAALTAGDDVGVTTYANFAAGFSQFNLGNNVPGTPGVPTATAVSDVQINLTLPTLDPAATSVVVYRGAAGGAAPTSASPSTSFSPTTDADPTTAGVQVAVTGLTASTGYRFAIAQVVAGETSSLSGPTAVATTTATPSSTLTVSAATPNDINEGIGTATAITVTFNEAVATASAQTIQIFPTTQGSGFAVTGTYASGSGTTLVYNLSSPLNDAVTDVNYTVRFTAGSITTAGGAPIQARTATFNY